MMSGGGVSVSGLTVDHVALAPDHALIVFRGVLNRTTAAQLDASVEQILDAGAHFLVADLSQVTRCDPAALASLAYAARQLSLRQGWLRLVATSPAVITALDATDVCDLLDLYHAHYGTRDAS